MRQLGQAHKGWRSAARRAHHKHEICDAARKNNGDPTGTGDIRRRWRGDLEQRTSTMKRHLRAALIEQDMLGIRGPNMWSTIIGSTGTKIDAFGNWFAGINDNVVFGIDGAWIKPYVEAAYRRGLKHASGHVGRELIADEANLAALQSIAVQELDGITDVGEQNVVRSIHEGMRQGLSPTLVVRAAVDRVDKIQTLRAKQLIAVAVIGAHAEGSLDGYEQAGVRSLGIIPEGKAPAVTPRRTRDAIYDKGTYWGGPGSRISREEAPSASTIARIERAAEKLEQKVGSEVEILTAGDDQVCDDCQEISDEGPYDIDEARGKIPAHVNCRCAFVPADDARFAEDGLATFDFNPNHDPDTGEFTYAAEGGSGSGGAGTQKAASSRDEAFRKWFGNSKVVDKSGKPLVVYHGTDQEFSSFERTEDIGFHFGPADIASKRVLLAGGYGVVPGESAKSAYRALKGVTVEGGAVIPVYLKIEKPLRLPDLYTWEPNAVLQALSNVGFSEKDLSNPTGIVDNDFVRSVLAKKGYDGIVYRNAVEGRGDSYIVFDPRQIKSAIGNRGRFDPKSPNLIDAWLSDYNPDQPREPSGSSEGGRWASGSGGGGAGAQERSPARLETALHRMGYSQRDVPHIVAALAKAKIKVKNNSRHEIALAMEKLAGKPIIRGKSIMGFHGTTEEVLADIKANGLVPKKSPGADVWAEQHGMPIAKEFKGGTREFSVYIAASPEQAVSFAKLAAEVRHQTPVLLRVEIPKKEAQEFLHPDEGDIREAGGSNFLRFAGTIKPQWIKEEVHIDKRILKYIGAMEIKGKTHGAHADADDDAVDVYLIVFERLPEEGVELQDFNPYHEPSGSPSGGRFTSAEGETGSFGFGESKPASYGVRATIREAAKRALKERGIDNPTPLQSGTEKAIAAARRNDGIEVLGHALEPAEYDALVEEYDTIKEAWEYALTEAKSRDDADEQTRADEEARSQEGKGRDIPPNGWKRGSLEDYDYIKMQPRLMPAIKLVEDVGDYEAGDVLIGTRGQWHVEIADENNIDGSSTTYGHGHSGDEATYERGFIDPSSKQYWTSGDLNLDAAELRSRPRETSRARNMREMRADGEDVLDYNPYHVAAGSPEGGQFASAPETGSGSGGSTQGAMPPSMLKIKHHAEEFASPNVKKIDFVNARAALSSHRQQVFYRAARDIDAKTRCGSNVKERNILGAWSDGAENSTMLEANKVASEDLRLNAAIKGILGHQKQVLTFDDDPHGPDQMYTFKMKGDISQIHDRLLQAGLEFHTLIPKKDGADVVVIDQEGTAASRIATVTNRTKVINGKADFIGTQKQDGTDEEQRADAERIFRGIIEGAGDRGRRVWEGLRDRWAPQLEIAEGHGIKPASSPWTERISAREFTALAEQVQAEVLEKHAAAIGHETSPYKARLIRNIGEAAVAARDFAEWTNWYDRHRPAAKALFGEDEPMFEKILAATSLQKSPGQNVALALSAYERWKSGEPFETWHPSKTEGGGGLLPAARDQLVHLQKGEPLSGAKIQPFAAALNGDWSKVVIDRVMIETLFSSAKNKTATDAQVAIGQAVITAFAKRVGWKPAEFQAALWCMHKAAQQTGNAASVTSFRPYIEAQIDRVHKMFEDHPEWKPKGTLDAEDVFEGLKLSLADEEEAWLNALMLVELFERLSNTLDEEI